MTGPCPRPENINRGLLEELMEGRGLNITGELSELIQRYTENDKSKLIYLLSILLLTIVVGGNMAVITHLENLEFTYMHEIIFWSIERFYSNRT